MVRIIVKWSWNVDIDRNQIEMEIGRNFFVDLRKSIKPEQIVQILLSQMLIFHL